MATELALEEPHEIVLYDAWVSMTGGPTPDGMDVAVSSENVTITWKSPDKNEMPGHKYASSEEKNLQINCTTQELRDELINRAYPGVIELWEDNESVAVEE